MIDSSDGTLALPACIGIMYFWSPPPYTHIHNTACMLLLLTCTVAYTFVLPGNDIQGQVKNGLNDLNAPDDDRGYEQVYQEQNLEGTTM